MNTFPKEITYVIKCELCRGEYSSYLFSSMLSWKKFVIEFSLSCTVCRVTNTFVCLFVLVTVMSFILIYLVHSILKGKDPFGISFLFVVLI